MSFEQTATGKEFFYKRIPHLISALEGIHKELKRFNDAKEAENGKITIYILSCTFDSHLGCSSTYISPHTSPEEAEEHKVHVMRNVFEFDPDVEQDGDYFYSEIEPIEIDIRDYMMPKTKATK